MDNNRRYDIDTLRVLAFLSLIIYHVAMFYVADWGWHIKSESVNEWLKFPMILINQWRMPLLFLISGVASSFLLRKLSAAAFIKSRSLRLWVPLTTAVLLVVPPQAYLQGMANGTIESAFGAMTYPQFLWHYFTLQGWPVGAFDGSDYGFTWNHLWFVPYLIVYTVVLIPFRAIVRISRLGAALNHLGPISLIVLPVVLQIVWQWALAGEQGINHTLIDDSYGHAVYFTFFALGYLISDKAHCWAIIVRLRWLTLALAVCTYIALIALWWVFNEQLWQGHLATVVAKLNQWLWLLTVLGWSARWLNKPSRWVRYANARIFPWYIFHQTLTIVAGYYLSPFVLGGLVEGALVLGATVAGCFVLTHYVVERSRVLRFCFGMKV
ncbi:acyltransferase family protein [Marinagarivorans algicola]|uniref:acyltransferase family protein n=1 Tax=Marinagarivorans algicola TaxID=1513270 RepID=UPI0006B40EB5|nr:acyltransferase family protein [Marinagarivorans algicola]